MDSGAYDASGENRTGLECLKEGVLNRFRIDAFRV